MRANSSEHSRKRSDDFLKVSAQFQLGALTTEQPHPVTANLSETAKSDIAEALDLLFQVDRDVLDTYREFVASGRWRSIHENLVHSLSNGGRVFFTGCGATGRLSVLLTSIWRDFWQNQRLQGRISSASATEFEARVSSVMAGGDFALIKSVEGFEDFASFGRKQLQDQGVCAKDVVFAITEGGETSFVIGTAWQGFEAGAKVYFVYNNPNDVLCHLVERSRQVIQEPRIEKLNLTTGPMAITGSTRMQATTIQLCVLLTALEMCLRHLMQNVEPRGSGDLDPSVVPSEFLRYLEEMHHTLKSPALRSQLAALVTLEETTYRNRRKNNYFAAHFGIDVLTDTTERSPTYCTPPFRKHGDLKAAESWAWLFLSDSDTSQAWERILKRKPACVEWTDAEIRSLVGNDQAPRTREILRQISYPELMRFRIGQDGLESRPPSNGDCAIAILSANEKSSLLSPGGTNRLQLEAAIRTGAGIGLIYLGPADSITEMREFVSHWHPQCKTVLAAVPSTNFLLDGIARVGLKMLLNALSTCIMVRLGRVLGNYMIWVVPSNLKLIDRATRYIQKLAGLDYQSANHLLFEVIEYIEPRMKADQPYPPAVGLAVLRAQHGLTNEEAERRFLEAQTDQAPEERKIQPIQS